MFLPFVTFSLVKLNSFESSTFVSSTFIIDGSTAKNVYLFDPLFDNYPIVIILNHWFSLTLIKMIPNELFNAFDCENKETKSKEEEKVILDLIQSNIQLLNQNNILILLI